MFEKIEKFLAMGRCMPLPYPPKHTHVRIPPPIVVFIAVIFLLLRRSVSPNLKFGSIPWSLGP